MEVSIAAGRPDRRRRDCDNLPKAILDLLTVHQVIQDEALAVDVRTRWDMSVPPGRVIIRRGLLGSLRGGHWEALASLTPVIIKSAMAASAQVSAPSGSCSWHLSTFRVWPHSQRARLYR